jgi:hypothetical protein
MIVVVLCGLAALLWALYLLAPVVYVRSVLHERRLRSRPVLTVAHLGDVPDGLPIMVTGRTAARHGHGSGEPRETVWYASRTGYTNFADSPVELPQQWDEHGELAIYHGGHQLALTRQLAGRSIDSCAPMAKNLYDEDGVGGLQRRASQTLTVSSDLTVIAAGALRTDADGMRCLEHARPEDGTAVVSDLDALWRHNAAERRSSLRWATGFAVAAALLTWLVLQPPPS